MSIIFASLPECPSRVICTEWEFNKCWFREKMSYYLIITLCSAKFTIREVCLETYPRVFLVIAVPKQSLLSPKVSIILRLEFWGKSISPAHSQLLSKCHMSVTARHVKHLHSCWLHGTEISPLRIGLVYQLGKLLSHPTPPHQVILKPPLGVQMVINIFIPTESIMMVTPHLERGNLSLTQGNPGQKHLGYWIWIASFFIPGYDRTIMLSMKTRFGHGWLIRPWSGQKRKKQGFWLLIWIVTHER